MTKNSMTIEPTLVFVLNNQAEIEFHRTIELTTAQQEDLRRLDTKMDGKIELGTQTIIEPNLNDRATYVANHLLNAYQNGNEAITAICMAYLGTRLPQLKQVKANTHSDRVTIQLVFDREYAPEHSVQFVRKEQLVDH